MKATKYLSCILLLFLSSRIYSQIPDTVWTKTFGGASSDVGNSVLQTNDGGFIIAATTTSFGAGGQDIYLIKTDENGDTLWTKTFGGTGNDRASNVVQTTDNGYAVFGTTNSYGNGDDDFLLWKTDSIGNTEWYKTFDGGYIEYTTDGLQAEDNGFILLGNGNYPNQHAWLIKTDTSGNEIWSKLIEGFGSNLPFWGYSVIQTTDSGYAVYGYSYTYTPWWEYSRSILNKFTSAGDILFYKIYNFSSYEISRVVRETYDGNLILGGATSYYELERISKVTSEGNFIWTKEISVSQSPSYLNSLEQDFDNGFIFTIVNNGNPPYGADFGLIKCDINGNFLWENRIGGSEYDFARSVYVTNDSGYIVTGETNSFGAGDYDIWLLKFEYPPSAEIQVSKDSLNLTFDDVSSSKDSLVLYNTGNAPLSVDTIYSTNASGFLLDIVLSDTTIHTAVTWKHNYDNPFVIEPNDSAKLVFTYPLWVPKSNFIRETWLDTIVIINNSVNNSLIKIPAIIDFPVGIGNDLNDLPLKFSLHQNYPNPFNPVTSIQFVVGSRLFVTLKVYDVLGNEIATLVNEVKQPGSYEVEFSATSHSGEDQNLPAGRQGLTSGIYFYQIRAGSFIETKKMVLLK